MKSQVRKSWSVPVLLLAAAAGLAGAGLLTRRHAAEEASEQRERAEVAAVVPPAAVPSGPPGRARFAITPPPGPALSSISYVVQSPERITLAKGTFSAAGDATGVVTGAVTLPAGAGAIVTFVGHPKDPAGSLVLLGQQRFDVPGGATVDVPLSAGAATAGAGGVAAVAGGAASCETCELASSERFCDPPNLTATSKTDPRTGEQTGVGWGCSTLPTSEARAACVALLRCIDSTGCGRAGESPVMGCYCGDANPHACLSGQGVSGPCVAEYKAAAAASATPPAPGAESQAIAASASDPTTPFGLADNVARCASDSHCGGCGSS